MPRFAYCYETGYGGNDHTLNVIKRMIRSMRAIGMFERLLKVLLEFRVAILRLIPALHLLLFHSCGPQISDGSGRHFFESDFPSEFVENAGGGHFEDPDGLRLIGGFGRQKPTIIYIHGWLRWSSYLPNFPNIEGWQQAGFNTIIYRWHHDALDSELCSLLGIRFPCADRVEQRIWGDRAWAGEKLVANYREFFRKVGLYDREIRLVGRSLGAQMGIYLSYSLDFLGGIDDADLPRPTRIDLIDPYISLASAIKGRLPDDARFPIPPDRRVDGVCDSQNSDSLYCVLENSLFNLGLKPRVRVVNYASFASDLMARDFRYFTDYQQFSKGFMCPKARSDERAECGPGDLLKSSAVADAEHSLPLLSYMWSISEKLPLSLGITGKTNLHEMSDARKWTAQSPVGQWCNPPADHSLFELGDLAFGNGGLEGGIPAHSKRELVRRLLDHSWSFEAAEQCASAISFENDIFEKKPSD